MSQFSSFSGKNRQLKNITEHLEFAYQSSLKRKNRTWEQLGILPGFSILDVGCGIGMDTIPFGKMVGPSGKVAGIDLNEEAVVDAETSLSEPPLPAVCWPDR